MDKVLFLAAAALMLSATTAAAQSSKTQLLAGGNTIGGPGTRTLEAGASEIVFQQSSSTPLDLCATVANIGKRGTSVAITVTNPGMTFNGVGADVGESATVCQKASNVVRVGCTAGDQCQVLWRVDQSR
jgi:hypothetical protein